MATIKEIIESQANAANINTSALDLYKIVNAAVKEGGPIALYDSAGVMPIDSDYVGSVLSNSVGELYLLDSIGGSWGLLTGAPIIPVEVFSYQGSNYGYTLGGYNPTFTTGGVGTEIDKFPFAADVNSTNVGSLLKGTYKTASAHSGDYGYTIGGSIYPYDPVTGVNTEVISKFPFALDGNAISITATTLGGALVNGSGATSGTYGYAQGGVSGLLTNTIQKFPFAAEDATSDVGDLTVSRESMAGQSSTTHGYGSGGSTPAYSNVIDKFSFASDGNATSVGTITVARTGVSSGTSSATHGYTAGGQNGGAPFSNVIDKFSFASDGNATDVGDLPYNPRFNVGQSSTTDGYSSGGNAPGPVATTAKYSFASDGNGTLNSGVLTVDRYWGAGVQY